MKDCTLSDDQKKRIQATLKRIREGLERGQKPVFSEPAHSFAPEAYDDKNV